ncbi:MAG: hypothetical protein WCG75_01475 [Armatimonadota bacterium]
MLGPECCFSFADLFVATEGRMWTVDEAQDFQKLSQDQKNAWVTVLAEKAPQFVTVNRMGIDGVVYRAFWIPSSSN